MIRTHVRSFALAVATTLVAAAGFSQVQPGDQSRWSLDFRASMEQSSAHPIEVHLIGDWISTVDAVRAGEYDAQLQLANIEFAGDEVKSVAAASLEELRARLTRPFWATFRTDGGLVAMHFYRDETSSTRNLLQMIATELQVVRPAANRNTWTAEERDGAGEYSALYVMPDTNRILKRKLKYIYTDGVVGARADAVRVAIDHSDITIVLTQSGAIQQIDGGNSVHMDLAQKQTDELSAITEFHASNLRTGHATEIVGSLEREHSGVIDSPVVTQGRDADQARVEADDRLLNGHTTEEILAAAFSKNSDAASADRLTALFRQRPEAASAAIARLMKEGPKRSVTNAMGASSSHSAVTALDGLAHNAAAEEDLRVDAILAFVEMQHPTTEAMHAITDLTNNPSQSIRNAARMISGALSRAGRIEHPTQADAVDASLIAIYRDAHGTPERVEMLGALGNSVGPAVVPVVEEALHDMQNPVRSAAARALRLAPGSDVDQLLATVITSDTESAVRADAVFATRFRHPLSALLADALMRAANSDTAKFVRSDAIAVLSQNPTASVRIPDALQQIAEHDSDPGIRQQAKKAMESLSAIAASRP